MNQDCIFTFILFKFVCSFLSKEWRYLKGTPVKGILFQKHDNLQVEVYTVADWAEGIINRLSIFCYCSFIGGNLVTRCNKNFQR